MRVTVLGCGGSMGVPMVGGIWGTCDPANPRNRRRRPSILVQSDSTTILIDTSPDLRDQLLDHDVKRVDALLFTHAHADHIHGIDDLRPLAFKQPINAYMDSAVRQELEERFGYIMTSVEMDRGFYHPFLVPHLLDGPFRVGDIDIVPFEQDHGRVVSMGYRFGRFAYSTDVVRLDDSAWAALEGVESVDGGCDAAGAACLARPSGPDAGVDRAAQAEAGLADPYEPPDGLRLAVPAVAGPCPAGP